MNIKDIFAKMKSITDEYNKTHDFSGISDYAFLVSKTVFQQIGDYYDVKGVTEIRYRGYNIWKFDGTPDNYILFAKIYFVMDLDSLFGESPMWKYFKEKGVKKKMAIDYKDEWRKLRHTYGGNSLVKITNKTHSVRLGVIMDTMINATIENREKLMEEFVKERIITTEIVGGDKRYHEVDIYDKKCGLLKSNRMVLKADFAAWCKKKEKKDE